MAMGDELDTELAGGDGQVKALVATGHGKRQSDDPRALAAHTGRMDLDRSPQCHRPGDELPGGRSSQRNLPVPRVHAAGALRIRCAVAAWGSVEDFGTTSRPELAAMPAVVGPHRVKCAIAQPPLPEADDGSDEIGGADHDAGTVPGRSSGCSLGSTSGGDDGGAGCGGTGTVRGSTVMRRDGPGIDARV